ncbi:MAG TPA: DUF2249 domain-containing protein [Burkholderiaceae bacterium]
MNSEVKLDARGLEPPEPMERVLVALSQLKLGTTLSMLIDREPRPLFRILEKNGFDWEVKTGPEYSFEVRIWHKA